MKRTVPAIIVFFFLMFLALTGMAATDDLKAEAIKNFQKAVVKALPTEGNIIRVAVLDISNDSGEIRDAIIAAITEKTSFKIIERTDLDLILKEQGMQLKDVMDEGTRIQPGKIKGVQGLLMGRVIGMESGFMSYTVRVHLKLDDVEKGEIVFAKDFNVSAVSPVRTWIFIAIALVIAIIVAVFIWASRKEAVKESIIEEDTRERVDLSRGIKQAMAIVSEARAKLMDKGQTDPAIKIKDIERDLLALKEEIENAPRGFTGMRDTSELKDALAFDKEFQDVSDALIKSVEKLSDVIQSGTSDLDKHIDLVKRDVRAASTAFKKRKI